MMLTEFLLARIAEDEAAARRAGDGLAALDATGLQVMGAVVYDPVRVLAECEAKRRIVEEAPLWGCATTMGKILALPYADHPDYREEWRA